MVQAGQLPFLGLDEDAALRMILEGTATETGERFFASLVKNLARALGTHGAWVTEYIEEKRRLRAMAFWLDGRFIDGYEVDIAGTPCEQVIDTAQLVHIPDRLVELYPADPDIEQQGMVSYMGVPLLNVDGRVLGHLAVVDRRPLPPEPRGLAILQIFAARAAAELRRLRAEAEVRERDEKTSRLLDSAMDAVIELDPHLHISMVNAAGEKLFGCPAAELVGTDFRARIVEGCREKLERLVQELANRQDGRGGLWIPGGLVAVRRDGSRFPAEATLSRYSVHRRVYCALILRNVNDRQEAERRIHSLMAETSYLREELSELQNFGEVLGHSEAIQQVLADVRQLAETDTTVLIMGETGTGKELIARAIHAAGARKDKPLVKVNCAAIPATLIESEFFGHEKGAFTGATRQRDGRFALADGGTIFLDEVGELPVELQPKLLRVLQEGEFEPVGSSQTRRVDVRVIAATNRNLKVDVREGRFREDLYYRLSVFPLQLPSLRQRGDDVALLAEAFTERLARKMGRKVEPLSAECLQRLKAYSWPGNVRELENVIERALITSRDGRLNLDRALPETAAPSARTGGEDTPPSTGRIRTMSELAELERSSILLALEKADWRVAGENGAARLLGMNASTLSSRMKALGIQRPN